MPSYVSWIADAVSILAFIFALAGWTQARRVRKYLEQERLRMGRKITVGLMFDGQIRVLPGELRREDLTRAEILGVLGMIPLKDEVPGRRYQLKFLNTSDFYHRINAISEEEGDSRLIIPCSQEEIDQFNFDENNP